LGIYSAFINGTIFMATLGITYFLKSDIDEDFPIYAADDTEEQAAARASLKPIFNNMVS
jgi:hypothetical protein